MFLVGCNNPNGREGTITGLRVVDHPRFSDKDSLSTNNAKSFQNQNEKP
jgi:hypothetical protein